MKALLLNWLANDGVWFQAVEFKHGLFDAKRCNDTCWAQFSPFEAWSIRNFLNLPENPGLEGLKTALQFRLYATINEQSIVEESPTSFVFRMNECRVQSARSKDARASTTTPASREAWPSIPLPPKRLTRASRPNASGPPAGCAPRGMVLRLAFFAGMNGS